MSITEQNADRLLTDYRNNGIGDHFKIGGNSIRGFAFTREELYGLVQADNSKHIFLMLALSYEASSPSTKFLTLIAGAISTSTNQLDKSNLQIARVGLSVIFGEKLDSSQFFELFPGVEYPSAHCSGDHMLFVQAGVTGHLWSTTNKKIHGYRLENADLDELGLRIPLTQANKSDVFMVVPVIRWRSYDPNHPFTTPYLSMAITRYTDQPVGSIREYCLPCPNACPNNYSYQ